MSADIVTVLAVAGVAAVASPLGGMIALWRKPTSLFMSLALGFAGGVLLATIGFEMMPQALELSSVAIAVAGFVAGFAAVHAFDLFVHRGKIAGPKAEQGKTVERYHMRHRPRGDEVTVLAGGTSTEEVIEGLSIGVGSAIKPGWDSSSRSPSSSTTWPRRSASANSSEIRVPPGDIDRRGACSSGRD
jgi:ZIP family zinc transporter